jgi:hypothetical protein
MKKKLILCIVSLILFGSCKNDDPQNGNLLNIKTLFPPYVDTVLRKGIEYSVTQMQIAETGIQMIDTFNFGNQKIDLNEMHYTYEYLDYDNNIRTDIKKQLNDTCFKVLIDTSYNIICYKHWQGLVEKISEDFPDNFADDFPDTQQDSKDSVTKKIEFDKQRMEFLNDSSNFIPYYPVYFVNTSDSCISLTYQYMLGLLAIQEAQDSSGTWKPIEYWYRDRCGTTYSQVDLKSQNFIFSRIKKYSGSFRTSLRIKIQVKDRYYYSKPFRGSINYSQFEIPSEISDSEMLELMLLR